MDTGKQRDKGLSGLYDVAWGGHCTLLPKGKYYVCISKVVSSNQWVPWAGFVRRTLVGR